MTLPTHRSAPPPRDQLRLPGNFLLMDAGLQHPASLLPEKVTAWQQVADMVCAPSAPRA